jgi:hypothetical protein
VDTRAGLDDVEKRKFLTPSGLELRPLGRPAHSQSLYRLRYPASITPCSLLKVNRCFEGTCRLNLQGRRIIRARNQRESRWQTELAGFLLSFFFDPEDGDGMFLRNLG